MCLIFSAYVQVILAGSLEGRFQNESGVAAAPVTVFREAAACWDFQSYFRVHRYHVRSKDDVRLRPLEEARRAGDAAEDVAMALRDSHIILRPVPFVEVVQAAVRALQAQTDSG